MSKKIGEELDSDIHFEMLNSFTLFIEHFSPVLDKAETYHKHIVAENLINPSESNKEKLETEGNIKMQKLFIKNLNNKVTSVVKIRLFSSENFYPDIHTLLEMAQLHCFQVFLLSQGFLAYSKLFSHQEKKLLNLHCL